MSDPRGSDRASSPGPRGGNRRLLIGALIVVVVLIVGIFWVRTQPGVLFFSSAPTTSPTPGQTSSPTGSASPAQAAQAADIQSIVQQAMTDERLKAAIVQVSVNGQIITTQASGESMTGVPATTDMHFRNGAVAFEYVSTLLLEYVDEGTVSLDDTIDKWMPNLPESNQVTLRMLAQQTTGYPDFETDPGWTAAYNANPFHEFTYPERLGYAFDRPLQFAPGTNWSYSHTNFMILGQLLSIIGGAPLDQLLKTKVLDPMGLTETQGSTSAVIPEPVLHAFSSERRVALGIPDGTSFTEESTFWNPVWGTPVGAAETTDITDMTKTAIAVGTGQLLSQASYHAMTDSTLIGFGSTLPSCQGSCFTQRDAYNYGLGVVRSGSWQLQNPLLSGYSATEAYLPSQKIAISVATTFDPEAFTAAGSYDNAADRIFRLIGAYLAPTDAPPALPAAPPALPAAK